MSIEMGAKRLVIRPRQAIAGDFLITSPVVVEYRVEDAREWSTYKSDLDYHRLIRWFNDVQHASIDGTDLFRAVQFGGVSLWQFLPPYLQSLVMRAIGIVDTLCDLIRETGATHIEVTLLSDPAAFLWHRIAQRVSLATSTSVRVVGEHSELGVCPRFVDYPPTSVFGQALQCRALSRVCGLWSQNQKGRSERRIIATSHTRHWVRVPGGAEKYDEQIYPLLGELARRRWDDIVIVDCSYRVSPQSASALWERMHDDRRGVRWCSIFSYVPDSSRGAGAVRKECAELWRRIGTHSAFDGAWVYRGISLLPALVDEVGAAFTEHLPEVVRALEVAEAVIRREAPRCLLVTSEAVGVFERALVIKGGMMGVPTVGLQHGMIFPNHYHYMHRSITTAVHALPFGFVRPNVTCVWGEGWKRNLTEAGSYPREAVEVTGNWRYDSLPAFMEKPGEAETRARFGIPAGMKVAVIVSGNYNVGAFVKVGLAAVGAVDGIVAIVKLHPLDVIGAVREILGVYGVDDQKMVTELLEGLKIADVVITQLSTVAGEALVLGKRVILVEFDGLKGWETYTQCQAFFHVNSPESLSQTIQICLDLEDMPKEMLDAREHFIREYYHRMDGKAAERVADVVDMVARSGRSKKDCLA